MSPTQVSDMVTLEPCPECRSSETFTDESRGDVICSGCGLVRDRLFEETPSYITTEVMERSQHNEVYRSGKSTVISKHDVDGTGSKLTAKQRQRADKLRWWEAKKWTTDERAVSKAAHIALGAAAKIGLSDQIVETAVYYYHTARRKGLVEGRDIKKTIAGALLVASKLYNRVVSENDLAEYLDMPVAEVIQYSKWLVREMDMKMPVISPRVYVMFLAKTLEGTPPVPKWALDILERAYEHKHLVNGKNPRALAAAAYYIATILAGEKVSQLSIVEPLELTDVAIRGHYKAFMKTFGFKRSPLPQGTEPFSHS